MRKTIAYFSIDVNNLIVSKKDYVESRESG